MDKNLFEIVYSQDGIEIWIDKKSGVNYIARVNKKAASITPLLDEDGNVITTPIYIVNPNVNDWSNN